MKNKIAPIIVLLLTIINSLYSIIFFIIDKHKLDMWYQKDIFVFYVFFILNTIIVISLIISLFLIIFNLNKVIPIIFSAIGIFFFIGTFIFELLGIIINFANNSSAGTGGEFWLNTIFYILISIIILIISIINAKKKA